MIGEAQLARLEAPLTSPSWPQDACRAIHHPPVLHKEGEKRNLRDRAALAAVLAPRAPTWCSTATTTRTSAPSCAARAGVPIPVVGGGSASYTGGPERRSRYSVYEIEGRSITWVSRSHDEATRHLQRRRREQHA